MGIEQMDREDVKAELRKRFGTIGLFEAEHGLPKKSVSDLLRGRASQRVSDAVESALSKPLSQFRDSDNSASIAPLAPPHRLNDEGQ